VSISVDEIVYVLGEFHPATARGSVRRASSSDEATLTTWLRQFQIDAGLPLHDVRNGVERMMSFGWFWEVEGEPVAMAGHAFPVGEPGHVVGRIGPVFTLSAHRRRGYGAAVTSAVAAEMQTYVDHIMLYADAANPASNSVYQRLGFVEYGRVAEVEFTYAQAR
jgi:predicted GNAT family acetyltransferase